MIEEYTPTTGEVRDSLVYLNKHYAKQYGDVDLMVVGSETAAQFDRWLAEEKAKAWTEGRESVAKDLMTPADETGVKKVSGNPYRRGGSDE